MEIAVPRRSLSELVALGNAVFECKIRPTLRPEDDDKFVAIDVDTGDYEIGESEFDVVDRVKERRPGAEVLLLNAGFGATCRFGRTE